MKFIPYPQFPDFRKWSEKVPRAAALPKKSRVPKRTYLGMPHFHAHSSKKKKITKSEAFISCAARFYFSSYMMKLKFVAH